MIRLPSNWGWSRRSTAATGSTRPGLRKGVRRWLFAGFALALILATAAMLHQQRSFESPIAYAFFDGRLYVVERGNRMLTISLDGDGMLELVRTTRLAAEDDAHYYIVRQLYPGRDGVVAHSRMYSRETRGLVGHRLREYPADGGAPRPVFQIVLEHPERFPELRYLHTDDGREILVNGCEGQRKLWLLPPRDNPGSGQGLVMREGRLPEGVVAFGPVNTQSAFWAGIGMDPAGDLYISAPAQGQVLRYDMRGRLLQRIGRNGFEPGRLLSPQEIAFVAEPGSGPRLTVASKGNRTWVQLASDGSVAGTLDPLRSGYPHPDILVHRAFQDAQGRLYAMDLVNKALVRISDGFSVTEHYRVRQPLLALLGAAVAALLAIAVRLGLGARHRTRRRFPFFLRLLLWFVPLLALSAIAVGWRVRDAMREELIAEYVRRCANIAQAVANNVAPADLKRIQAPEDHGGAAYERVFSQVDRIVDRSRVLDTPKWIIHKIRDGRFYYGINIWRGAIYEPFICPTERRIFHRAREEKTPQWGRFADEQGEWFSYLHPFVSDSGEVTHVLELYRSAEEMDRAEALARSRAREGAAISILVVIALAFLFSRILAEPLRRLTQGVERVSAGDFDHRVDVRTHDEVGVLAQRFNEMVVTLKRNLADLARNADEHARLDADMRLARQVQEGILPTRLPPYPGCETLTIFAEMEPARAVGGDFYDVFHVDDDHIAVVVGDVSGKGISAGMFMMLVRTLLRGNARGRLSPARAVGWTNRFTAASNPEMMFATLFYLVCNRRDGFVRFTCAGHNPPLLLRRTPRGAAETQPDDTEQRPRAKPLTSIQDSLVGVEPDTDYHDNELRLLPGDRLVIYTDGVTEPVDADGEPFGEERLMRVVDACAGDSADACGRTIRRRVDAHQAGLSAFDDFTLVVLDFLGDPRNPGPRASQPRARPMLQPHPHSDTETVPARHFILTQEPLQLSALADGVEAFLTDQRVPAQTITRVNLCLEELLVNSIEHGLRGRKTYAIQVHIERIGEELAIEIVDDGAAFDPIRQAPPPNLDPVLVRRPLGGLGLYLVEQLASSLDYRRDGDCNRLRLTVAVGGDDHPERGGIGALE